MARLLILGTTLWLLVFLLRITQIGGLDPTYRDQPVEVLKPLQQKLAQICNNLVPQPQGAILSGMLVGSSEKIPYFFKQDLISTSTIHIIVVSGQNLSILAGFLMNLSSFIGRRKTIVLTLLVIVFYSFLTGLQTPVLRAALMSGLSFLAQLIGRETAGWWVLMLTAGLMLLYNPNYIFSISFQLSFLATLGVVVVAPVLLKYLNWVPKILREDLGVSFSAQLLTLPIIAFYFGRVSLIGILVNVLVLWNIPILMITGFISLGLGLINLFLGQVLALIPAVILTYFIYIVKFFAKIPGGSLEIGVTHWVLWLGYYLIIIGIIWGLAKRDN